ncbi:RNA polymerase B [Neophaeococcomyces mojaviensis]|uniref:RNA polymerase B n=1 Tax=Neophaeococcomyces mojaviensis TaxID=3383035 RepID=A0ACC3AAA0_9EURO|nr:RNA polymerase B [Knufia sp. JES_112]
MAHAAPSRDAPVSSTELTAGRELQIGEYAEEPTLNLSEARIILTKTLETRKRRKQEENPNSMDTAEPENLVKTRDYLEIFSVFKDLGEAQQAEAVINVHGTNMERFERSQLGSLVPSGADEAKALIPSLEKKVEDGLIEEETLETLCVELTKIKRQAQLGS